MVGVLTSEKNLSKMNSEDSRVFLTVATSVDAGCEPANAVLAGFFPRTGDDCVGLDQTRGCPKAAKTSRLDRQRKQ